MLPFNDCTVHHLLMLVYDCNKYWFCLVFRENSSFEMAHPYFCPEEQIKAMWCHLNSVLLDFIIRSMAFVYI